MKLSQCSAFVAVAETESFTRAGLRLGTSQSAVSHAVAALEKELGVTLLQRERSGVLLTPEGRRALQHARAVVHHAELVAVRARSARTADSPLRVATVPSFASQLLPRLMAELAATGREPSITVRESDDKQICRWLRAGAVDVGITYSTPPGVATAPLVRETLYALVARDHPLAGARSVAYGQVARLPLIIPSWDPEAAILRALREADGELVVSHHIRDLNTVLCMVGEGLGATILPDTVLPTVLPDLQILELVPGRSRQLSISTQAEEGDDGRVRAFAAAARQVAGRRINELRALAGLQSDVVGMADRRVLS
ncbi:LysR family transcriptional regulator [Streptomyces luteolus]|uniref:LysR family transcriptional regulator n=1 Tax=Streptomyces luteolus TaxID=3043615 RepID=A0ABT6SQE8_9ACTN|nr:LysR family transcriptional regulator [Streptomyces sp. B-S-A12]MDI3417839.1 LysR family transcriptional regulator [Streptomyces sp. B-S-A12]